MQLYCDQWEEAYVIYQYDYADRPPQYCEQDEQPFASSGSNITGNGVCRS